VLRESRVLREFVVAWCPIAVCALGAMPAVAQDPSEQATTVSGSGNNTCAIVTDGTGLLGMERVRIRLDLIVADFERFLTILRAGIATGIRRGAR
jgi:hypothetical protein